MFHRFLMLSVVLLLAVSCTTTSLRTTGNESAVAIPPAASTDVTEPSASTKETATQALADTPPTKPNEVEIENPMPGLTIKPWLLELRSSNQFHTNGTMANQTSAMTLTCRVSFGKSGRTLANIVDFKIKQATTNKGEHLVSVPFEGQKQFEHVTYGRSHFKTAFHDLSARTTLPKLPATSLTSLDATLEAVWMDSPVQTMKFSCQPQNLEKRIAIDDLPDEYFKATKKGHRYTNELEISSGMIGHLQLIIFKSAVGQTIATIKPGTPYLLDGKLRMPLYKNVLEGGSVEMLYYPRIRSQVINFTIKDIQLPISLIGEPEQGVQVDLKPVAR